MEPKLLVFFFCPRMLLQKIKKFNWVFVPKAGCVFFLKIPKIYHRKVSLFSGQLQLV